MMRKTQQQARDPSRQTLRALALATLASLLWPAFGLAQSGNNLQLFSNGYDLVYAGVGAGGTQVAGVDGLGTFVAGEDLRGSTLTSLGDFGYSQVGLTESACVLGAPLGSLRLDFPLLALFELDGRNPNRPDVFTLPLCGSAGSFPLGNSVGLAPFGTPPGASASFLLGGLPSGLGLPTSTPLPMLPNHGLLPTVHGGTVRLLGAAMTSIPIASTGFCWTVNFGWAPSAMATRQDADGLWHWLTNARDGNQYWAMSNDELNVWQTRSALLDGGATAVTQFLANLDYAWSARSVNPVTQEALAPTTPSGSGPFATTGAGCPLSGHSINGGFDLGRHVGLTLGGSGGVPNPFTGVGNQDPAGSAHTGQTTTLGFVTFNNNSYSPPGGVGGWRLLWAQIDFDLTFGVDPALAGSALVFAGQVRVPVPIPASAPVPWPQPLTQTLLPLFVHDTGPVSSAPLGCWSDPSGSGLGYFDIVGASAHLPTPAGTALCIGLPVGLQFGSIGLLGPAGPVTWDPAVNQTSLGRTLSLID